MRWDELHTGPFTPTKVNGKGVPWVVAFVIHEHGRVVIKGMENVVDTVIKQRFPKSIFKKITYYVLRGVKHHIEQVGKAVDTGIWTSHSLNISVHKVCKRYPNKRGERYYKPFRTTKRYEHRLVVRQQSGDCVVIAFRNFPKHWLPVYDTAASIIRQHDGHLLAGQSVSFTDR